MKPFDYRILDRVTLVSPLGLRFWDRVLGTAISDGLRVTAYRPELPDQQYVAFPNHADVFIVRGLPGLRDFEHGAGDDDFWKTVKPLYTLTIEVQDEQGRFLPFRFDATVPFRGIYSLICPPPPAPPIALPPDVSVPNLPHVPLYSSPARTAPGGTATLYAELAVKSSKAAAAWAWMAVSQGGKVLGRGVADEAGHVAILFPYPPMADKVPGNPLSGMAALPDQAWTLDLTVGYQANAVKVSASGKPDLCQVLMQPAATLDVASVALRYGQPTIVRSSEGGKPLSVVWLV